jgi:hypothetical protein
MSGSTPSGFPYALSSDPLVQWPTTSQQLAEKLEAVVMKAGTSTWVATPTGLVAFAIPNPPPGKTLRSCQITIDGATLYANGAVVAGLEILSATGGNLIFRKGDGSLVPTGVNVKFHYLADFS